MKSAQNTAKHNTSIAGWSFALARALENYGIDPAQVFDDAGVDLAAVTSADARLPVSGVQQVWRYAAEHSDDYFGITVAGYLTPASFHALGFALWSSSTVLELLERLIRYRCVISHRFFCELLEEEEGYRLMLVDERSVKSEVTHDAFMAYVVGMARQLNHPEFTPESIRITRAQASSNFRDFFSCEIEAGSNESSMLLGRESLLRPLRYGNPDLAARQDTLVEQYIAELGLISEYMLRVRTEIHRLLSAGPVNIELVAENLNITVRTLQRRLSAEQSSYNLLLDQVRHQLAMAYIKDPTASATEIGFKLGFSDSGSFGRSFKRWTRQSFTEYRDKR